MRTLICIRLHIVYMVSNHYLTVGYLTLLNNRAVLVVLVGYFTLPYNVVILVFAGCFTSKPLYND